MDEYESYLKMIKEAQAGAQGASLARRDAWIKRLHKELDNLQEVMRELLDAGRVEEAMEFATTLNWFWFDRGQFSKGADWYIEIVELTKDGKTDEEKHLHLRALQNAGTFVQLKGDLLGASAYFKQGFKLNGGRDKELHHAFLLNYSVLEIVQGQLASAEAGLKEAARYYEKENQMLHVGGIGVNIGQIQLMRGNFDKADKEFDAAQEIFEKFRFAPGMGQMLSARAGGAIERGNLKEGSKLAQQSMAVWLQLQDPVRASAGLLFLAEIEVLQENYRAGRKDAAKAREAFRQAQDSQGEIACILTMAAATRNMDEAIALYKEAMRICQRTGSQLQIAPATERIAYLVLEAGNAAFAAQLFGYADNRRVIFGTPVSPVEQERYNAALLKTRTILGNARFDTELTTGESLSLEEILNKI